MKISKTIISYASIIAVGLLIGYLLPRLPRMLKPDYQEADYSAHFQNNSSRVLMYGTASCSYCQQTRAWFAAHNVAFTDLDVQRSPAAAAKHQELGSNAVPVIIIGNRLIRGYQPEVFEQALKLANKTGTAAK